MKPTFPFFILIIGLVIIYFSYGNYKEAKRSESWPMTTAVVTGSEIKSNLEIVYEDHDGYRYHKYENDPWFKKIKYKFVAVIKYQYTVNNQKYEGSMSVGSSEDKHEASDMVTGYPKGKKFPVYYDTQDPNSDVWESGRGYTGNISMYMFIGVVVCLLSFVIYWYKKRKWKEDQYEISNFRRYD